MIYTEQMPIFHIVREVHFMVASEFWTVYHVPHSFINAKNEKAQFKVH